MIVLPVGFANFVVGGEILAKDYSRAIVLPAATNRTESTLQLVLFRVDHCSNPIALRVEALDQSLGADLLSDSNRVSRHSIVMLDLHLG